MKYVPAILLLFILNIAGKSFAQYYDDPKNHDCLKCHSQQSYSFHNDLMDTEEKRLMNPYLIIDTIRLRTGVHKNFDCTDCHSYEYTTYPHGANLKLEPMMTCLGLSWRRMNLLQNMNLRKYRKSFIKVSITKHTATISRVQNVITNTITHQQPERATVLPKLWNTVIKCV